MLIWKRKHEQEVRELQRQIEKAKTRVAHLEGLLQGECDNHFETKQQLDRFISGYQDEWDRVWKESIGKFNGWCEAEIKEVIGILKERGYSVHPKK